MSASREQFGSRLGFILAAAGSAVGIGNMVGFPVAATKSGGGAFLIVYAVFIVLICLPVMIAEMTLGRATQKDPLGAYKANGGSNIFWKLAGWLSVLTPFMIAVFYTVITVWIMGYLVNAAIGNLDWLASPEAFGEFINGDTLFAYMAAVFAVIYVILQGGVRDGIERVAKFLMPLLFFMLIALVIFVLTLDNAMAGVTYYLVPDFSKIDTNVINIALSQAFFSLSLGMGIMITYGSYLDKRTDIAGSAKLVALTDSAVAFIAGLLILPAIFSFNPETDAQQLSDSSVGMIFTFLPKIFLALQTSFGYVFASVIATVFFLLVFFAAITSLVSIIEVPTASLMDEKNMSRKKALATLGVSAGLLAVFASMSFGLISFFTEFTSYAGQTKSLFDVISDVFYDTILPLNGLLVCLLVIYRWKKVNFNAELREGSPSIADSWLEKYLNFALSGIIPFILAIVFLNTVASKFFGHNLFGF